MSPENLENLIDTASSNVLYWQQQADEASCLLVKGSCRDEARRSAKAVADLVAQRTPETVRAMEEARGLL